MKKITKNVTLDIIHENTCIHEKNNEKYNTKRTSKTKTCAVYHRVMLAIYKLKTQRND